MQVCRGEAFGRQSLQLNEDTYIQMLRPVSQIAYIYTYFCKIQQIFGRQSLQLNEYTYTQMLRPASQITYIYKSALQFNENACTQILHPEFKPDATYRLSVWRAKQSDI
ncbi:MAG: hypothetical protein ACRC62_39585 [Microcoleus sp.]